MHLETNPRRGHPRSWTLLALVVLLVVAACGGGDDGDSADSSDRGGSPTTEAADAGDGSGLTIADFAFSPSTLEVAAGTTVQVTNDDGAAHTWTADDDTWDSDTLSPGDTFSHEFTEAGTFPYHCAIHPSMTGTVTVTG